MKRFNLSFALLFLAAGCVVGQRPCQARFAQMWEPVPMDRLLTNVTRYVHDHPGDPAGHYTLGRLHSLKFARGAVPVEAIIKDWHTRKPLALPEFSLQESIVEKPAAPPASLTAAARQELSSSIREYRRALELNAKKSLYWLGLGWMIERGMPFAKQMDAPFLDHPARAPARTWSDWSLAAYRRAYSLDHDKDLAARERGPHFDEFISEEAGQGILRILGQRTPSLRGMLEAAEVRRSIKKIESLPQWITPVIFSLDAAAPPRSLLDPSLTVPFDLRGDGRETRWTWVGPQSGILIWDPVKAGHIISGRQLFGSVTWSMFWQDGYASLAALDDDGNGWLEGKELDGIAAWFDRNDDGVCNPGEVVSLAELGIDRIAVHSTSRADGMLTNPRGLQRRDGSFLPTYDWIPMGG